MLLNQTTVVSGAARKKMLNIKLDLTRLIYEKKFK